MGLNLIEVLGLIFLPITFSIRETQTHTDTYTRAHTRRVSSSSVVVLLVRISSSLSPFSISVSVLFVVLAGCPFFVKLSSADPTWTHARPERSQLTSWKSVVRRSAVGCLCGSPSRLGSVGCLHQTWFWEGPETSRLYAAFTYQPLPSVAWSLFEVLASYPCSSGLPVWSYYVPKGQVFVECSLEWWKIL